MLENVRHIFDTMTNCVKKYEENKEGKERK